jgi:hypothetical protein
VTAFTFSVEQIRSAPPEVRRWIANEISRAFGGLAGASPQAPASGASQPEAAALAACTVPEVMPVFELIADDPVASRLFFELAREHSVDSGLPEVRALKVADLLHHVGLPDLNSLLDGLTAIDRAFHQIHGERAGGLFGLDDAGHVYLHEVTQSSIRRIWEELVRARATAASKPVPQTEGFMPPHVGPSEDVAAHAARPLPGGNLPF